MSNIEKKLNFTDFPIVSELRNNEVFGNYIELNILSNTEKICSFNCSYCYLGQKKIKINSIKDFEYNMPISILHALDKIKSSLILQDVKLESILVSGNGEPSLHPNFLDVAVAIQKWKQQSSLHTQLVLLTNGAHFQTQKALKNLQYFDEIIFKLDSLNDLTFKKLNNSSVRTSVSKLINTAQKIESLSIQSIFTQGTVDNTSEQHVEDFLEVISMLKPKRVLLETIFEPINSLKPCPDIFLYNLANKIKKKIDSKVIVNI